MIRSYIFGIWDSPGNNFVCDPTGAGGNVSNGFNRYRFGGGDDGVIQGGGSRNAGNNLLFGFLVFPDLIYQIRENEKTEEQVISFSLI